MTAPTLLWRTLVTVLIMAQAQWSLCDCMELPTRDDGFKSRAAPAVHIKNSVESFALARGGGAASRFNLEVGGATTVPDMNGNISSGEVEVLLSFKNGITRDPTGVLSSWRANSSDPCSWFGVECSSPSSMRVTGLNLAGLGLEGMISASLGQLSFLRQLDLSINVLNGSIPTSLANCSDLMYLNISFNKIVGNIPALLGNLDKLQALDLSHNNMIGEIPMRLVNCSSLQSLVLAFNSYHGEIPFQIGLLSNLRLLDLKLITSLSGSIPASLGNCSSLQVVYLDNNALLTGELPIQVGKLTQLRQFYVQSCNIYGSFPKWNISSLRSLNMGNNGLLSGTIPEDVGLTLPSIRLLGLHGNLFSGVIPKSVANMTSLVFLYLRQNEFTGSIPHELGLLSNLTGLYVSQNPLTGIIPSSLSNCSLLAYVDLGNSFFDPQPFPHWFLSVRSMVEFFVPNANLQGTIPHEIGQLSQLTEFSVMFNNLTGAIPSSFGNCTYLRYFLVNDNKLTGDIPSELGLLSNLSTLLVEHNAFTAGPFPPFIYNITTLTNLAISGNRFNGMLDGDFGRFGQLRYFQADHNDFQGPFPESVTNCSQLTYLDLSGNQLSGGLPDRPTLNNLTNLVSLVLGSNNFDGDIPGEFLRNLQVLQELDLSDNNFGGTIPVEIGQLVYVLRLNISGNNLTGPLPDSIASCKPLLSLDLSQNQLDGSLPGEALGRLISLIGLNLSRNSFSGSWPLQIRQLKAIQVINISSNLISGSIPSGLGGLDSLETLDIAFNQLTGQIPADLGSLVHLATFNASYNNFSGPIPDSGAFKDNITAASFLGDPDLCGGILGPLRQCPSSPTSKSHCTGFHCSGVWIPVTSALGAVVLGLIIGVAFVMWSRQMKKENVQGKEMMYTFYPHMRFRGTDILAAIAPGQDNVIGVGGQSVVYKGISPTGETVAIKASRNVQDAAGKTRWEDITREASTVGQIRHRNVVKVFCVFFNFEVACIIMEYMPKGSLHAQLQTDEPTQLTWAQRFKILLGVTHGMVYLHHEFPDPIIHRDLKPSNILLGDDLEPKICDFGISRFVTNEDGEATASSFCGTVGYIPPEYATEGRLSTKGDVYSYGVVLLELLTKKQVATTMDLVSIVEKTFDESKIQTFELLDPFLRAESYQNVITSEQMMLTLRVGILCTRTSAQDRPSMNHVLEMLLEIKVLGQEPVTRRVIDDLLEDE